MRDELLNNRSKLRASSLPLMGANTKQVAAQRSPERKPETPGNISSQQKYVLLFEWWLMKASKEYDGRRLAVGGFTRRRDTVRIFNSVPIVKRHDPFTLETANGIILKIEGSLNKTRTIGNEFPLEACSIFLFGFPAAWEFFAYKYTVNQASHQLIQEPKPGDTFDSPLQPQTVMLRDWWLSKNDKGDEGYQLSVGGLTKWGKATRLFNSAPIIKRHNAYTLETVDGMTLRLQGFIDKIRTFNNGFTHEVCRNFLIGFPITWTNVVNESSSGKPCYSETSASASTGTEWFRSSPEKMSFQFPMRLENRVLDDVPSTPSAVATDSFARPRKVISKSMAHSSMPMKMRSPLFEGDPHQTPERSICSNVPPQDDETRATKISTSPIERLRQAIKKFMAKFSLPKKTEMPTANVGPHHMPEKNICENVPAQDDETTGTKIRTSSVDNNSEYYEADRRTDTEGEGYQTVSSHVDRAPLENSVDPVKFDFTREAMFRNDDMCSEHALSNQHVKGVETCIAGVSWYSIVENDTEKEEMMQIKHQKFDKSSNKRVKKLRYDLSKHENLLGEYQKSPKYSIEPIRRSKRLKLSSVVDEDCQGYSQSDCMPNDLKYSNLSTDGFKLTDMRQPEHNSALGSLFSSTRVPFASGGNLSVKNGDCHQSRNVHEEGIVGDNPTRTKARSSQKSERRMTRLEAKKKNVHTDSRGMKERKVEVSGDIPQSEAKASCRIGRKTVWVSSYKNVGLTSLTQIKEKKLSILTPDSISLKRSRSGRVLVPRLDCSMRIVYDADGSISGTALIETSTTASKGSRSNAAGTKAKKRRPISSSRISIDRIEQLQLTIEDCL